MIPGAIVGSLIARPANRILSRFFKWFNRGFDFVAGMYGKVVGASLRLSAIVLLIYGGLIGLTYFGMTHIPTGIHSVARQRLSDRRRAAARLGIARANVAASSASKTRAAATKGVIHTIGIPGQSFVLNAVGSNLGSMFIILDEFEHRHDHSLSSR